MQVRKSLFSRLTCLLRLAALDSQLAPRKSGKELPYKEQKEREDSVLTACSTTVLKNKLEGIPYMR